MLKWILIGLGIAAALTIGGCVACVALIGVSAEQDRKAQQRNAIPDAAARALPLATPRATVTRRFGDGTDAQGEDRERAGDDCLFYNLKGDEIGRQWGLCFDGRGRLAAKYRWG